MRIAIVGPFPPFRGGIADLNSALAHHLSQAHDISAFNFTTQYPKALFPGKTQLKEGAAAQDFPNIRCLSSVNPTTWKKTASLIAETEPDIVIFRYWMPFFAPAFSGVAKRIKKQTDINIIAVCDNIIPHEQRALDQQLSTRFFNYIDSFIVLSKKVEEELLSILPDANYKYSPHPIYSIFMEAPAQDEAKKQLNISAKNVLMFFGLIREYKGLDILIKAVGKLKDYLGYSCGIVCDDCYEEQKAKYESIRNHSVLNNKTKQP